MELTIDQERTPSIFEDTRHTGSITFLREFTGTPTAICTGGKPIIADYIGTIEISEPLLQEIIAGAGSIDFKPITSDKEGITQASIIDKPIDGIQGTQETIIDRCNEISKIIRIRIAEDRTFSYEIIDSQTASSTRIIDASASSTAFGET